MNKINTVLNVDYAQYAVIGIADNIPIPDRKSNGIADSMPEGVVVRTGTHLGYIKLQVELRDQEPPLSLEGWDEVVEVSFESEGYIFITALNGCVDSDQLNPTPGPQRLRVHVRGRDEGRYRDTVARDSEMPEEHLLQIWPAPVTSTKLLKTGDEVGTALRAF